METGKIYRVNDFALSEHAQHRKLNRSIVKDHGYLWIRESNSKEAGHEPTGDYFFRSLATGEVKTFYPFELEAADGDR